MRTHKLILILTSLALVAIGMFSLGNAAVSETVFGGEELPSPSNWIKEEQIKVYNNRVILNIENPVWAGFTDTNSMDPFIDVGSHAIEIKPKDANAINVGDVISYESDIGLIIHRVIEKSEDEEGIYYILKGDNNRFEDPEKVRFDDVHGVVVAVIY